jgi:hypothetical protein
MDRFFQEGIVDMLACAIEQPSSIYSFKKEVCRLHEELFCAEDLRCDVVV